MTTDTVPLAEEFRRLCEAHDMTYAYSDDSRSHIRGRESYRHIEDFAAKIDRAVAVRIWNETVDKRVREGSRHFFYWQLGVQDC